MIAEVRELSRVAHSSLSGPDRQHLLVNSLSPLFVTFVLTTSLFTPWDHRCLSAGFARGFCAYTAAAPTSRPPKAEQAAQSLTTAARS